MRIVLIVCVLSLATIAAAAPVPEVRGTWQLSSYGRPAVPDFRNKYAMADECLDDRLEIKINRQQNCTFHGPVESVCEHV